MTVVAVPIMVSGITFANSRIPSTPSSSILKSRVRFASVVVVRSIVISVKEIFSNILSIEE